MRWRSGSALAPHSVDCDLTRQTAGMSRVLLGGSKSPRGQAVRADQESREEWGMLVRFCMIAVLASGIVGEMGSISAEEAAPDVSAEWAGLVKDMEAFKESMESLKLRYSKATAAEKAKLAKEANTLNAGFQGKTYPRMIEIAAQVYKLNPEDTIAAELTLQTLFAKNQYEELVKVSDGVLKKDPKAQIAANFNGVGRFATHDFEGAITVLKAAEVEGILIPQLGGQYLDTAEKYVDFWKEEQGEAGQ